MKALLCFVLMLFALAPAQAELLRSGLGGRVPREPHVRRHDGGHGRHGGDHRRDWRHQQGRFHGHRPVFHRPYVHRGFHWDYGYGFGLRYPYRHVGFSYGPFYEYGSGHYRNVALDGLWLGALAGGIIGNNSGAFRHDAWRGAAWGAGVGWLLGSVADANRRAAVYREPATIVRPSQAVVLPAPAAPAATTAPQSVTIINNYYGNVSPMSAANAMFGR